MNWEHKVYQCTQKGCNVEFRVGYKQIQHKVNGKFVNVASGAGIVICTCGCSFWIPEELKLIAKL